MLYTWNWYNVVSQLYFNKKNHILSFCIFFFVWEDRILKTNYNISMGYVFDGFSFETRNFSAKPQYTVVSFNSSDKISCIDHSDYITFSNFPSLNSWNCQKANLHYILTSFLFPLSDNEINIEDTFWKCSLWRLI